MKTIRKKTSNFRLAKTDGDVSGARKMIAKYDYDSRQLSPNVDAEQVINNPSFCQKNFFRLS